RQAHSGRLPARQARAARRRSASPRARSRRSRRRCAGAAGRTTRARALEHVPAAYPYPVEHTDRTRRGFLDKYPAAGRVDEDHGMSGFEDESVEFFRRTQLEDRERHIEVERVEPPSEHPQITAASLAYDRPA